MKNDLAATRRLFLRVAASGAGGMALNACGGNSSDAGAPPASSPAPGPAPSPPPPAPPPPPPAPPPPAPAPPPGNVVAADPSTYRTKLAALRPGDTLVLAPGNYGVTSAGADTSDPPGLPIFGLNGTASAPITIMGTPGAAKPVLLGRSTHNTVRFDNASYIVVRNLVINGRDLGGSGVAVQGPCHHITIEDCEFYGHGSDQQITAISTTGQPTWGWVVRRNLIVGAGTGMYFGNSTWDSPFVDGLIEYNVVRDTIGYGMQVKRQAAWASIPAGMPTGKTTTVIRHNVFAKSANSSTGNLARPNLLVGDCPPSGPGSTNDFAVYGNFFFENPSERLFQCEGNVAFYANVLVNSSGDAVSVQNHDSVVRDIRIFHNTVVAAGVGIAVSGGVSGSGATQRVLGNAVFAGGAAISVTSAGGSKSGNFEDARASAPNQLGNPLGAMPSLSLFPKAGSALQQAALDMSSVAAFPDANRDFNGTSFDPAFRGAYSGQGTNPGWTLAIGQKPAT